MGLIRNVNNNLNGLKIENNYKNGNFSIDLYFHNDEQTQVYIKNSNDETIQINVLAQNKCNHGFYHDTQIELLPGEEKIIGNLDCRFYNDKYSRAHINCEGNPIKDTNAVFGRCGYKSTGLKVAVVEGGYER